jgi:Predicted GTPase
MTTDFERFFYETKKCIKNIDTSSLTDFAIQFDITGKSQGTFYVEYRHNILSVQPYDYHDRTALIVASKENITNLFSGHTDIYDELKNNTINISCNSNDGFRKVCDFFDSILLSQNSPQKEDFSFFNPNKTPETNNPWDTLRICIEQANIDEESKKQLLANLVKFTSNELHILVVGACGCGKSSTINALFNIDMAEVGYGVDPQTQLVSVYKLDNLYLHDSPGLGESPKKDRLHIKKIENALREVDSSGNAVIDVVLVIVDGSHRDMKASFELINEVIIPNLQQKDRILVAINRCDLALDGRGWISRHNYPNAELLSRLKEKSDSVKERIFEDTGVTVEPIFYSALHKYNISKLLSYLVKSAPPVKRIFFAEKINNNTENFLRDDTVTLSKKKRNTKHKTTSKHSTSNSSSQSIHENSIPYEDFTDIKKTIGNMSKKINSLNAKLILDTDTTHKQNSFHDVDDTEKKRNATSKHSTSNPSSQSTHKSSISHNNVTEIKESTDNTQKKRNILSAKIATDAQYKQNSSHDVNDTDDDSDYELITTDTVSYQDEYKKSMEESFIEAEKEINKDVSEKIKLKFVDRMELVKEGIISGAAAGKLIGEHIPVIGAVIGGAIGAVLGGVGGIFAGMRKKNKK